MALFLVYRLLNIRMRGLYMKQIRRTFPGRSLPEGRLRMKNITELEYQLRKYTSDKTRLEKEHE